MRYPMVCKATELNKLVLSDRRAGMTYKQIAKKYGFSASRARQHCTRAEWIERRGKSEVSERE